MYMGRIDNYKRKKGIFNVGLYTRISREDDNESKKSISIVNQKNFLTKYIVENALNIIDI